MHIPAEKIWKPDILLVNNADSWAKISSISTNAIVKHDGNVTWLSTVIFKSSCSINVKNFPFDEQTCDMIFASWTFDGFFLDLNLNSEEGDITNYIKNGEWHLVQFSARKFLKMYSCCEQPYPEIHYKLTIRRRPLYYVFNLVFPCLLITLVAFLGFYLPPDSREKVSIGITTLLSLTVFLMLVAESMPPTSELPLLSIYYAATIGIVSLSTAMAVITLNINNKGGKFRKVPTIIKIIFLKYLAKLLCIQLSSRFKTNRRLDRLNDIIFKKDSKIYTEQFERLEAYNQKKARKAQKLSRNYSSAGLSRECDSFYGRDLLLQSSGPTNPYMTTLATSQSGTWLPNSNELNMIEIPQSYEMSKSQASKVYYMDRDEKLLVKPLRKKGSATSTTTTTAACNSSSSSKAQQNSHHLFNQHHQQHRQSSTNSSPIVTIKPRSTSKMTEEFGEDYLAFPIPSTPSQSTTKRSASQKSASNQQKQETPSTTTNLSQHQSAEFFAELERILSKQFNPLIICLVKTLKNNEKMFAEKENDEIIQSEWSDVAMIIDRILCYAFSIITLTSCVLIFNNSPNVLSDW